MSYNNGFGVEIITTGRVEEVSDDYVALPNNTQYMIKLCNQRNTICDVVVRVDNQKIGGWRIDSNDCIVIERPGDDAHRFTFFSEISSEALNAGVQIGESNNGLISATFYPKKEYYRYPDPIPLLSSRVTGAALQSSTQQSLSSPRASSSIARSPSPSRYQSGVTLLGAESQQRFRNISPLSGDEIDWNNITTIHLRLIARKEQPRYYRYRNNNGNSIPPRIDNLYSYHN